MNFRLTAAICFLLFSVNASAQQFGGFPPNLRWQKIRTDTATIIFAPGSLQQAQRIAALVHQMAGTENPLGSKIKPISIVLHQNTTLANGYVGLAPFRSEFYLIPGSNLFEFGNLPWSDQLAVHEYRHVQQYNNFNRGLSRAAGFLLGQEGRALANAVSVPDWFFEGDAVYAETVYTPQGRGRQPYFFNSFNALWKEGRHYSWAKLRNGSYRDQVPGHYPLGYLLVNYGYSKYGPDFWAKVTRDASAFRGLFYPFQQAIQRHAGISFRKFREEALASYAHEVSRRRDAQAGREVVTNIYFPQQVSADTLMYLKDSYQSLPAFYRRTGRGEERIALRGISSEDWLNYRKGTIAYTTYSTNARWSLIDYSDIILLNTSTGKRTRITQGQKYFTPALSPDDSTLVAVAINDSLQSELRILSLDGRVLRSRKTPAGALFVHPQYADAQNIIVGLRHSTGRLSLNRLDLTTMKFSQLLPTTRATIGFFYPTSNRVYFTASLNGTDDLYELNPETKTVFRLTTGGVGHYFPSLRGKTVTWSEFTSNGLHLRQGTLDSLPRIEVPVGQWGLEQPPFEVAGADSAQQIVDVIGADYPVSRYRNSTGLLNFHSWRPYYEDPEFTFSVFSDNVLNTFSNEFYYRYNQNENSHAIGWSAAYSALYPVLTAGVEHTFSRTVRTTTRSFDLSGTDVRVGYYIPLNFTRGSTYKYLRFGSDLVFNHTEPIGASKSVLTGFSSSYLSHTISWTQQLPRTQQQIFPRLGYALSGNYRHRLDEKGYLGLGYATVYLPGLFRTHSLVAQAGIQQVDTANVLFANRFSNSRGYPDYFYSRMWKLSANYHLPVAYPEAGIANIVYLSRMRLNGFYDFTKVYSRNKLASANLSSVGGELTFDTRWWNSYPISLTLRYSRLLDANRFGISDPNVWELVLPVSIIPR